MNNVIDHLSVSQINTFFRCPMQWYFRYIEKKIVPPNGNMTTGKAVHAGHEIIYTEKLNGHKYVKGDVLDAVRDIVDGSDPETDWGDSSKATALDVAVRCSEYYMDEGYPDSVNDEEIEAVEQQHIVTLIDPESFDVVDIILYPDLELKDRIRDTKTKASTPKTNSPDYKFQAAFYAKTTGKQKFEVEYIVKKKNPAVVIIPERVGNMCKVVDDIFLKAWRQIKACNVSGDYPPSGLCHPWACNYCGYGKRGMCKYHMGDS